MACSSEVNEHATTPTRPYGEGFAEGAGPKIKMASSVSLLVILSVSCVVIGGISKRADAKDDVCSENSIGMSFLQTEGLLNLHQKS